MRKIYTFDDRNRTIGSSDARTVMSGEWSKLYRLKTDEAFFRSEQEVMRLNLHVQIGLATEDLHRVRLAERLGVLIQQADTTRHPNIHYLDCNLDGFFVENGTGVVTELKHVIQFADLDEQVAKYYPQVQHQLEVMGWDKGILSFIKGTTEEKHFEIPFDPEFVDEYLKRCALFWAAVEEGRAPADVAAFAGKVKVNLGDMIEIDMTKDKAANQWSVLAGQLVENAAAHTIYEAAEKDIKLLMPDNAKRAFGNSVEIKRSANNAKTVKVVDLENAIGAKPGSAPAAGSAPPPKPPRSNKRKAA